MHKRNSVVLFFFLLLLISCEKSSAETMPQRKIDGVDIKDILTSDPSWKFVTDLSQLNGIWKGFYSELNTTLQPGIAIQYETEIIQTIDASAKTISIFIKSIMTYSGNAIEGDWKSIKEECAVYYNNIIVDDENHRITVTQDYPGESLSDRQIAQMFASAQYQINETGDKIRYPSGGFDGEEPHILILSKKD